ncbi:MAG: hypothetical protein ACR2M9_04025 [Cyanophyceae cyanobacterium]
MATKIIIRIPTYGSPSYCLMKKQDINVETIQKIVQGYFQEAPKNHMVIHPMFREEQPSWNIVGELIENVINDSNVKVWCNENGMYDCCPNMGVIDKMWKRPFFGDLCIEITPKKINKIFNGTEWKNNIKKCNSFEEMLKYVDEEEEEE